MEFVNYHCHRQYSNAVTIDCAISHEDYIRRIKELGHETLTVIEHGYTGGMTSILEAYSLCKKNNIKMLIGAECYFVKDRKVSDDSNWHIVIIALNHSALRQLNLAISLANETGFYKKARLDYELISKLTPENFIVTSACIGGVANDTEIIEFLKNHFKENFYLEIQSHNHIAQINFNKHILSLSEQYDIELIHGCDTHWITEDDKFKRKILLSGKGMNYGDEDSFENDYPSYDEILERYRVQGVVSEKQAKSALENTMIIKEKTEEFAFNDDIKMPTLYPNETHEQKMKRLENILNQEYKRQYGHLSGSERKRYLEAIRYETSIIRNTCMEDYFLLNYYIIKRAKELGMILTQTGRGCFTEDLLVHTNNGLKQIKDVKIGDYVVSSDGKFNKVLNTMQYDVDEELVQIKHLYGTDKKHPMVCTLDHKILINRNSQNQWLQAKDIKKGDFVCVPKMKMDVKLNVIDLNDYNVFGYEFDDEYIYETVKGGGHYYKYSPADVARQINVGKSVIEDFANMKRTNIFKSRPEKLKELFDYIPFNSQQEYAEFIRSKRVRKINRYITLDNEFNVFIGLMYGDGCVFENKNAVSLAINTETSKNTYNRQVFNNVAKRLNLNVNEDRSKNRKLSQLHIYSKVFTQFAKVELFNSKLNTEKIFNEKWFYQSVDNLKGIVKGFIASDGHIDNRINFDNTSKSLINAYKLLCLMTDMGVNSLQIRDGGTDSRGFNRKKSYKLRINPNSNNSMKKNERTKEDGDYYYLPVKEILFLDKQKTTVYDLTVENNPSYLANNMIVHNSAVSFLNNKLLGFTEVDRLQEKVQLYPTRFMSESRILQTRSLPDIDFNMVEQTQAVQATKELLGEHSCYVMLSYGTMKEKATIKNVCRSLGIDADEANLITKDIEGSRNNSKYDEVFKITDMMGNVIDSVSPNPCGYLILNDDIREEIGIIRVNGVLCAMIDKHTADKWKYLKNDFLMVSVYDIISKVYAEIGEPIDDIKSLRAKTDGNEKVWKIYEQGLTATLNQTATDSSRPQVMQYKPKNVEELTAFVAAIRPSFASMKDYLLNRKPFSYNIPEFDKLLESSMHFVLFQENIMATLVYVGFPEDETYGLIKAISKKDHNLISGIKDRFINGFIEKTGSEENAYRVWQIIEDASAYGFNSSHALSVAYDSLYGAYLKSHYPLQYYAVTLNLYENDQDITALLTSELPYFNIELSDIKFGFSKSKYTYDKETMTIYKGMKSIKYLNEKVSDELYELSKNNYNDPIELFIDIVEKTSCNARQIKILIMLNFFSEFGEGKYLLNLFELINKRYDKKHKDKTKQARLEEIRNTEIVKEEFKPSEIIAAQKEYLGYATYKDEKYNPLVGVITDISNQYATRWMEIYFVKNGKTRQFKIKYSIIQELELKTGDMIYIKDFEKRPRKKLVNGKWVNGDVQDFHITNIVRV